MERNAIGKPKINTKIEYADPARTLDFMRIEAGSEEVNYAISYSVYYPQIGLTIG